MGPRVDPYEGVAPQLGAFELERLRSTLDLPAKNLRAALLPALSIGLAASHFAIAADASVAVTTALFTR
jgi:hypothetical protein